jgi:hypothetical protein
LDGDSTSLAESLRGRSSIYLVAQDPYGREESAPIEQYFDRIFQSELEAWHTDPAVDLEDTRVEVEDI